MLDVCVIGFGFSAIPLIRELDLTGTNFQIVTGDDDSVWDRLVKCDRLDFSLVSSYITSFYSFDLVKDNFKKDFFPTAKQFYEMHMRWRNKYAHKVIRDFVVKIENFKDYSLVYTKAGQTFQTKHVVVATGFERPVHDILCELDFNVSNKTFVLGTMGDSANLVIAKLIPNNNKIVIRSHGFTPFDQELILNGEPVTYDQHEYHNVRYASPRVIRDIVMSQWFQHHDDSHPALLTNQFPLLRRDFSWIYSSKSSMPNGLLGIKYWPIEQYKSNFGDNLEQSIAEGYLLNDIAMYVHTGKVIVVPPDTPIDFENKTITYAGIERAFHQYIKFEIEYPRLPTILINGTTLYQYDYRDSFMGVIPQKLTNLYFLGYTRPTTASLGNITEIQSLFIHKLITQPTFHSKIHKNLSKGIVAYNQYYYGDSKPGKHDHLVLYGFYTDDVARLIGIEHKPSACKSLKDLMFYYLFANNAFKYRVAGEYAVDGVPELIEKTSSDINYAVNFATILKVFTLQDCEKVTRWYNSFPRIGFNDMRYKEPYREFLNTYIDAYRRVKKTTVDEVVDEEWDLLVSEACKIRDTMFNDMNSQNQVDEDFQQLVELLVSLMYSDIVYILDLNRSGSFGPLSKYIGFIHQLWQPMEYSLPFLYDE